MTSSGGASTVAARSMNATAPADIARQLRAGGAGGQMTLDGRLLLPVERSVHVVGQQNFQIRASHNVTSN